MTPSAGGNESRRVWSWRVFLTCWLVYTAFWAPYIVREHFPALALLERGSLDVTAYVDWSKDIFRSRRGGAFINNLPGASLTAAAALLPLRPVLERVDRWNRALPRPPGGEDDGDLFWRTLAEGRALYFLLVGFLTVALVMAPATAGAIAYLCARLMDAGVSGARAAQVALLCGLATPVFFRTGYLNHNLLVGDAGLVALLLLWDPSDRPLSPGRAAVAGLLAGYAVLCDYSGVVVVAVAGFYAWLRSSGRSSGARWRVMAAFSAGVAPALIALAAYQLWAFGSLYRPPQHYMTPTAPTKRGYRGLDWPSPALLWANFFDPRFGLFAFSPVLFLAFAAPFVRRVGIRVPRRETGIILTYFVLFVVFCAANQYSWLQPSTGFRYLVPVVPLLALLAVQVGQALPRPLRWVLAAAACAQSLLLAAVHSSDAWRAAGTLWRRGFKLPWMIRLGESGVAVTWVWPLSTFLLLAAALALVWLAPGPRRCSRARSAARG